MSEVLSLLRSLLNTVVFMAIAAFLTAALLGAVYFPYDVDDPALETDVTTLEADEFYEEVYAGEEPQNEAETESDHEYVVIGREAGESLGATAAVEQFVEEYGLEDARVLEVGAGSGQLQDIVEDYTGLDIAASAARYFHKPFVHGSATDMPFRDDEFDAVWTVWTLEHVPNPELAMSEMRRVTRPGGLIFLAPAWNCNSWAADGYEVRPYGDFGLKGKLVKASLLLRANPLYQFAHLVSSRLLRYGMWQMQGGGLSTLRYRRIEANYDEYWVPDSDAAVSIDPFEALLWHTSRGDQCLNCPSELSEQLQIGLQPLVIQVQKEPAAAVAESR